MLDNKSRFVVRYESSPNVFWRDTVTLFTSAIQLVEKEPDAVTTDSLLGLPKGWPPPCRRQAFRHDMREGHEHTQAARRHNAYERFVGTVKDRIKRVCGFRSELPTLHVLFPGYRRLFRPSRTWGGGSPPLKRWA